MASHVLSTDSLIKKFLFCMPINKLDLLISQSNADHLFDLVNQKKILDSTINSDLVKSRPIKHSYQKAFLKWFMNKIQEKDNEIHDDIYAMYCNLISLSPEESTHYRHFSIDGGTLNLITVQESTNIISDGTTGLRSWQGAIGLSKWCEENKSEISGKVILELGCGVGLTGLTVISTCSLKQYIFSDCHKAVLNMACENIKLNLIRPESEVQTNSKLVSGRLKLQTKYIDTIVEVMELKWEDIDQYIIEQWIMPDVIIAADIIYDTNSFHALATGLKAFLSFVGRYAVIAATIRNVDTFTQFLTELGVHNLYVEELVLLEEVIQIQLADSPIRILKISRKT